jgi:hypothetical protein
MRIRVVVAALLISCAGWFMPATAFAEGNVLPFTDIKGCFAETAIVSLVDRGILSGLSKEFKPGEEISRLEFSVLLAKALGVQPFFPREAAFSDLAPGRVETGYVEALANLNIIHGSGGKKFGGDQPLLRQDAAVILHQAFGDTEEMSLPGDQYKDSSRISSYAREGVSYAANRKWMVGSQGWFFPRKCLTRAEAVVLMEKVLDFRQEQAQQGLPSPTGKLVLTSGESQNLEIAQEDYPLAFTPVLGTNNPELLTVSNAVYGQQPGSGMLTVNIGRVSYPVTVEVKRANTTKVPVPPDPVPAKELALTYRVAQHSPDSSFQATEYKNYAGPEEGLTSKSDIWTGFLRQQGRDIVIDLGALKPVSSISMEFRQDAGQGIYFPEYLSASISADGFSWYRLGEVRHGINPLDRTGNMVLSLSFPPVVTRYLTMSFPVDIYVFARHLSVRGVITPEEPVILALEKNSPISAGKYLEDPTLRDILLVFTGDKTSLKNLNADDFLPLVAYVDSRGRIKGRMFDTIQFMPYTGIPCTKDSWESYLDDLFTPGQQLHALDEAMERFNSEIFGVERQQVILTLLYPDNKQEEFGILEAGATPLSFSPNTVSSQKALQNRLQAVKWYYEQLMEKWNQAGFTNLSIGGIYWYKESVDPTIAGEVELVRSVSRLVDGYGHNFVWIPYFGAPGFETWQDLGFTHAFLQPNYYATQDPPEDRMDRAAEMAKRYSMGIELELDNRVLTSRYYYDLFYKEMNRAFELGMNGNTSNAYYVGFAQTLLDAKSSEVPLIRRVYDDLYRWINEKYIPR